MTGRLRVRNRPAGIHTREMGWGNGKPHPEGERRPLPLVSEQPGVESQAALLLMRDLRISPLTP
jgi:hypothetical protein